MDILNNFGIQWTQLLEYGFNFLVLVILLRLFVYKPVVNILEKRKEMIDTSVKDAEEIKKQKELTEEHRKKIVQDAYLESKKIIEQATKQSQIQTKEILAEAAKEAQDIIERAKSEIQQERTHMYTGLKQEMMQLITLTLNKVLKDNLTHAEQAVLIDKSLAIIKHEIES